MRNGARVTMTDIRWDYREKPALTASRWNIWTVSSENCSRFLPSDLIFGSRSLVMVMMWHPTWSAWTRFSTSRGLAQISSARGAAARMSTERAMIGIGSTPASAIRPANTDTYEGAPSLTASVISSTWAVVNSAVTLTLTPLSDSSRTSGAIDSPDVVVTGILTYTLSPQPAIRCA